jgi:hypothetical protein
VRFWWVTPFSSMHSLEENHVKNKRLIEIYAQNHLVWLLYGVEFVDIDSLKR